MQIASVADVESKLSSFLRESKGRPIIITRKWDATGRSAFHGERRRNRAVITVLFFMVTEDSGCREASNSDPGRSHTENSGREWKRKGYESGKIELPE